VAGVDAHYYVNRGDCLGALGRAKEALEDYRFAHRAAPGDWNTRTKLSVALYRSGVQAYNGGSSQVAEQDLTEALTLNPKVGGFYEARAHTRYRLGDLAGAHADFRCALALTPARPDLQARLQQFEPTRPSLQRAALGYGLAVAFETPSCDRLALSIADPYASIRATSATDTKGTAMGTAMGTAKATAFNAASLPPIERPTSPRPGPLTRDARLWGALKGGAQNIQPPNSQTKRPTDVPERFLWPATEKIQRDETAKKEEARRRRAEAGRSKDRHKAVLSPVV
jgi:tetratricopeptide (TPR) repeat protein